MADEKEVSSLTLHISGYDKDKFEDSVRKALVEKVYWDMKEELHTTFRQIILSTAREKAKEITKDFLENETTADGMKFADFIRASLTRKGERWHGHPSPNNYYNDIRTQAYNGARRIIQKVRNG